MYNAISPFLVGFQLSVKQQSKERRSRCIKIEVNASTTERRKIYSFFTHLRAVYSDMKCAGQIYFTGYHLQEYETNLSRLHTQNEG